MDRERPASLWRIQQILLGALVFVVLGCLSLAELIHKAAGLGRHVFDSSRKRSKQAPRAAHAAQGLRKLRLAGLS